MHVLNVKGNQSSIVAKDASNRIGLRCISLNVPVKCLKQETQYFLVMSKELKLQHHLLKRLMIKIVLHQINKDLKVY
jgi:hypothetical protein